MAFQYLTNVALDKAREEYLKHLRQSGFSAGTETVAVPLAAGRVTAKAVYAHICAPHYLASAMDGIALKAADTFGAGETEPVRLLPEQFTVVDTGDPVPEGCDAVVMVEEVQKEEADSVILRAPAAPWQHIRQIGEDICAGEMLLPAYTKITPAAVGAMLAAGVMETEVIRRPVVGIIPTGDEIVPPSACPKSGDIIEFNSSIFSGMLREWSAEPRVYPIVPDKYPLIRAAVEKALAECDMVLLNAGSSAGREDFSSAVIGEVGQVLCHGIAIKPGKPAILGCAGNKPVLGVPGYPVSGIIVIEQFLKPILESWYHEAPAPEETVEAVLSRPVVSGLKYEEFVRVRLGTVGGRTVASPLNRGSGVVTSFMKADGILRVPQGTEGLEAGTQVRVRLLKPACEIGRAVVAIGSHDPLLDEIADLLHRKDPSLTLNSSHVGSMGGIMAVRRGETHIAGVHLLDEKDGTYNTSYIKKYFPQGGVRLVECVQRTQGLMLTAGNPKHITGLKDITRSDVRYVNRQKGSGTRVLLDYLLKQQGIDPKAVSGYEREEFTHTSVAAQIAAGTAEAGMGIYSAAQVYGLGFLPVCREQYDLLIPDDAFETPGVQALLEVLKSSGFRERLEKLGGYELETPGRVREHF